MLVIGSLSLVIIVQTVTAAGIYDFARQCKSNTEPCVSLRCSSTQRNSASLPVGLHYLCCNGKICLPHMKIVPSFHILSLFGFSFH